MKINPLQLLQPLNMWQLCSFSVFLSVLLTEAIVAGMGLLLKGEVPPDYLVTGLVTSFIVASLVISMLSYFYEKLADSELQLRTMIEAESECVKLLTADGTLLQMNKAGLDMLEADSPDQIIGRQMQQLVMPEYQAAFIALIKRVFEGKSGNLEFQIQGLKGTSRWLDSHAVPLRDTHARITALLSVTRDITQRKLVEQQLQESEERLNLSQEYGGIGSWEADLVNNRQFWSRTAYQLVKFPVIENPRWDDFLAIVHPDDRQKVLDAHQAHLTRKKKYDVEYRVVLADGEIRWMRSAGRAQFTPDGIPLKFIGIVQDITEQKLTEEMLRFHSTILKNVAEGVLLIRASDGMIVFTNPQFDYLFGYEAGELSGQHVSILNAPGDKTPQAVANEIIAELQRSEKWVGEVHNIKKDGTAFWCRANVSSFRHPEFGQVWVSVHDDITERKAMENELHTSEKKFRLLIEQIPLALGLASNTGELTYINNRFKHIFGYTLDDVPTIDQWYLKAYPDENYRQQVITLWTAAIEHALTYNTDIEPAEYRVTCKNGEVRTMMISGILFENSLLAMFIDVTERKRMEQQLRDSEAFTTSILDSLASHIAVLDAQGTIVAINNAWRQFATDNGLPESSDNMIGENYLDVCRKAFNQPEGEDTIAVSQGIKAVLAGTCASFHLEHPCYSSNQKRWFYMRISPLKGSSQGVVISHENITQRKQMEDILKASETQFRSIIEASPVPMALNDAQQNIIFLNPAFIQTFGYDLNDIPALSDWWPKAYPEADYRQWVADTWQATLEQTEREHKTFTPIEVSLRCKNGLQKTVLVSATTISQSFKNLHLMVLYDISERKQLEEKLRNISLYTRNLIEVSLDPLVTINAKGKITDVNKATEQATGFARAQLINTDFADYFTDPNQAKAGYLEAFFKGHVTDYPLVIKHCNGSLTDVLYNAVVYKDETGQVAGVFAAARDISALKQTEAELRELNRDFVTFLENTSDFIYFKDKDSRIRFCSQTLATITLHKSWRDLVGKHDFEIFPAKTAQIYYQEELPVFTEGLPLLNKIDPYYNEDGSKGWVSTCKWPVFDFDNHQVIGIFGISRDITQLKQIEQNLQENELMLKEAQEIAHLGHWILDIPDNELYWSDEIYRIFGVSPQEFEATYQAFLSYVHPEDRSFVDYSYTSHLTSKTGYDIEHRVLLKDGTVKYVSEKCKTEFSQDGQPLRSMGVVLDITERKQLEEKLRNISLYTRNLIEVSLDPLVTISTAGKITDVNKATEKITGFTREQLINSDFAGYFSDPEQARAGYLEAFSKGYVTDYPLAIKHRDGGLTDVLYNAVVYKNENGETAGVFAAARDISALKQTEAELKRSNADLEQFAYSVSHDMRQPLRSIAGHLQLLARSLKDKLDDDEQINLDFALDGAKRMDAMILSLLDYSRVGRKTEIKAWISSRIALNDALEFLTPAIEDAGVQIKITGDWEQVFASHDELTRLFMNLIGNAVKYREAHQPPCVEIDSVITANTWKVRVRDYGIGINPQQIDRLFQFFSRLQSRTRFEGTGMGLALCRKIVEHHGGRIWVESPGEGHGCCFIFELPLPDQESITNQSETGA